MNVVIVGAGASGLVCAIRALENGHKVTILERNNKVLKKLLLTGNGRCNFWNENMDKKYYYTSDLLSLETILEKKDLVLPFFDSLALIYKSNNGYLYPFTGQAISVYNALLNKALYKGANIILNKYVKRIKKENNKFMIECEDEVFEADKVVLATGSMARPNLGSDGNGYNLAQSFGHHINPVYPALVQLESNDSFLKDWDGVRTLAEITLEENGKIIKKEMGELQLTSYGISGIAIFNISSLVSKGLALEKKEVIKINFAPWCLNKDKLKEYLDYQFSLLPNYNLKQILEGFLNYKIVNIIFKLLKLNDLVKWNNAPKEKIIDYIMNFSLIITGTKSFKEAQTATGGIPLEEINPKTMESKLVKGLYLIGEILDVDGICGGYNLGFAWMSAIIAGDNI